MRKPQNENRIAPRFVSEVEVAEMTGLARRTLQKFRLLEKAPPYYKLHGAVRYNVDEVIAWVNSNARGRMSA